MKVVQILHEMVNTVLPYSSLSQIPDGKYDKDFINTLIEAPDYVFANWGYKEGEWIKPKIPEGFSYSDEYGFLYPTGSNELARIQIQNHKDLYYGVVKGLVSKELFKQLTKEEFIEDEVTRNELLEMFRLEESLL